MSKFKPLMTCHGVSFLISVLMKLSGYCSNIVVVNGYQSQKIIDHVDEWSKRDYKKEWFTQFGIKKETFYGIFGKVQFVFNADFASGMFSSLQTGLRAVVNKYWIFYHFVDQPHIPPTFYQYSIEQISSKYDWVQPKYDNKKGHPLFFNQRVKDLILNTPASGELRLVSEQTQIRKFFWDCPYHQVLENINIKSDLKYLGEGHEYF